MSDTVLLPAPECQTSERDDQWERERLAFLNQEPALLQTHRGKFVAIHDGEVVDCDADEVQLGLRVYGKYGYMPIYFGLVAETSRPPVRVPSPRLRRSSAGRE
jgi:hypothetical protein